MATSRDDFTQRRRVGENDAVGRVWTYNKDKRISIRERTNDSGGVGFRVTLPVGVTGGKVLHLQSKDFEAAKVIARSREEEFRTHRSGAMALSDKEKTQARAAMTLLEEKGHSDPLDVIADRYAEAMALLAPFNLTLIDAAKLLAKGMQSEKETGKPLAELVAFAAKRLKPEGGNVTVAKLAEEMIEMKKGWQLRPASIRDFEQRAGKIAADLGSLPLPELTKATILGWLGGLKLASRTRKNYRMVLAEMLSHAKQKRYLMDNPLEEVTRQDVKQLEGSNDEARQPSILSPEQAEALLRTAFAQPDLDLGGAVVLGLFCGIRTEELKRLKWDAVRLNGENSFVTIGAEIAKKRRIRNVPIPTNAVAWLQRWKPTGRGEAVTRSAHHNDYQKRFQKLAKAAGIVWEGNAMRHSFGTYFFAKTGDSIETARRLGHKQDDNVLFTHYRALATKEQGVAFFDILPAATSGVIQFPAITA